MGRPATKPSLARRALTALAAVVVAVGTAIATPLRRSAGERKLLGPGRPEGWRYSTSAMGMARRAALPSSAPAGQQAREMPFEQLAEHPETAINVPRVITIYREAEMGWPRRQCDLFDGIIEGDCTLRSLVEGRVSAVAGKPFVLQAGGAATEADQQAARALAAALALLPMIECWEHQLTFNRYGFACTEIVWGPMEFEGRTWIVPVHLVHVPARRFRIDVRTNTLRLLTEAHPTEGEELRPGGWIVTTRSGAGSIARGGLMRTATFPACYKRFGTRDWLVHGAKFGLPLVLVSYEAGAGGDEHDTDDTARQQGEAIIRNIGSDGGAVVEKGLTVEIKEVRNADNTKTHGGLITFANLEMARLVNGSTLATDNSNSGGAGSSYALGAAHADVRFEVIEYDAARLEESFRVSLATAFITFSGFAAAAPKLVMQVVRDLAPKLRVECAQAYMAMGGKVSRQQMAEDLGFREPLNADDTLVATPAAPANPAPDIAPAKRGAA